LRYRFGAVGLARYRRLLGRSSLDSDSAAHNERPSRAADEVYIRSTPVSRGIVSKRKASPYRSGRATDWLKAKNPKAPAVTREAEED